ncbi:MAG: hydroxymyristoyl-ACP dehydratase [Paludibacteraceae bacterium]
MRANENGEAHFAVRLNTEHRIYEGHFPQMPVVPGVCTIQMVKECLQTTRNEELQYTNIINCKFPAMIVPSMVQELLIDITTIEEDGAISMKASVKGDGHNFLSLKASLKRED